jgi:hypothetical protein
VDADPNVALITVGQLKIKHDVWTNPYTQIPRIYWARPSRANMKNPLTEFLQNDPDTHGDDGTSAVVRLIDPS